MRSLPFVLVLWLVACAGIAPAQVIHSDILGEDRTIQVHLPASYACAPDRTYPTLYLLDGESHFEHSKATVDFLAEQGEIPEMIVVAVTSTVRIRDFTQTDWSSHWIGGGGAGNFRAFLSTELIPGIERDYRTNGFRILSGHSAGGQFALYCLSSQPDPFQAYVVLSPSLDWDDKLPQRSLAESFGRADSLPAFVYFAWSDDSGEALQDDLALAETLEKKAPKGFRAVSKGFPEETHGSIPLVGHIHGLRELFRGYRLPNDAMDRGLAFVEDHFRDVSRTVGYSIPVPEGVLNELGYQALRQEKVQEAVAIFRRYVEENPNSPSAYDGLADACEAAGMWAEARVSSRKAAELGTACDHPSRDYFAEHAAKLEAAGER